MKLLWGCFILFVVGLFSCASSEQVPDIDVSELPRPKFEQLRPRSLELEVENIRRVNVEAGNEKEVSAEVARVLKQIFSESGIVVGPSPNRLKMLIRSCPDSEKGFECVRLESELRTKSKEFHVISSWEHAYVDQFGRNAYAYGEISPSYQGAIKLFLERLDEKLGGAKTRDEDRRD